MFSESFYGLIGIGIQTVLFLLAVYGMVVRNDSSVNSLKIEVKEIQKEVKAVATVITQIAVQATRLDNLSERMNAFDNRLEGLQKDVRRERSE